MKTSFKTQQVVPNMNHQAWSAQIGERKTGYKKPALGPSSQVMAPRTSCVKKNCSHCFNSDSMIVGIVGYYN